MEQSATQPAHHVKDFMTKDPVVAHPNMEAYEAITLLLKHEISGMPVMEDDKIVGLISERDCLKTLVHAQYHELPTALVKDLMSTNVETTGPNVKILEVARFFLESRYRRLPVLENGRLIGIISRCDILRAIQKMG